MTPLKKNFIEKLSYQLKTSGVKMSMLAEFFGVAPPSVSGWLKNGSISKDRLPKLAEFFGTSIDYWMTVVNPESEKPSVTVTYKGGEFTVLDREFVLWDTPEDLPEDPERIWVDLWDYSFSAGTGKINWDVKVKHALPFNSPLFKELDLKPKNAKLVRVDGQSMEPYLFHGDTILLDISKTDIKDGKIYAVYYDGEPYVKQLFKTDGAIRLHSYNPKFQDRIVEHGEETDFQVVGRVVFRFGAAGL